MKSISLSRWICIGFSALLIAISFLVGCQSSTASSATSASAASSASSADVETAVTFSVESGAYQAQSIDLTLSSSSGLPIVYTTDGSLPTASSVRFDSAISIDSSDTNRALIAQLNNEIPDFRAIVVDDSLPTATVIRAAVLRPDGTVGPTFTNTYFVDEDLVQMFDSIMVVSLVVDPANLLDYESGIMAKGAIYDEHRAENELLSNGNQHEVQANYTQKGRDWEREATIELFDGSNTLSYEAPCGIRLRGRVSRIYAQKSFNVYFKDSYGTKKMEYPLFGDIATSSNGDPVTTYKSFCLRSGGNDTELLRYRDSLLQETLGGYDYATQASRPAIVFLNGEFYGVYSLAEKYSDSYIESHYGVDSKNVVMFEDGELDEGVDEDQALYNELIEFAERDLADEATWNEFNNVVDVQSMADYYATQLFIGNYDFDETQNCRIWRARDPEEDSAYADGRWRWMLYDTEFSTGLYGLQVTQADYDTMKQYLEICPLFAAAMRNPTFRELVRSRIIDLSQNAFEPTRITTLFDEWWVVWKPWINLSCKRFATKIDSAEQSLTFAKDFFARRADCIIDFFDLHVAEIAAQS